MRDILILVGLLFILSVSMVGGGFFYGRIWERKIWERLVPNQMDVTCEQCEEIGVFKGYKKGKEAGLQTCDDVLSNLDDGGRR